MWNLAIVFKKKKLSNCLVEHLVKNISIRIGWQDLSEHSHCYRLRAWVHWWLLIAVEKMAVGSLGSWRMS